MHDEHSIIQLFTSQAAFQYPTRDSLRAMDFGGGAKRTWKALRFSPPLILEKRADKRARNWRGWAEQKMRHHYELRKEGRMG